jgi:hypothetical protein
MEQGEQKQKDKVGQCLLPTPATESSFVILVMCISLGDLGHRILKDLFCYLMALILCDQPGT